MKKIIAIAGSISSDSINKKLVSTVAGKLKVNEVEVLNLNDYLAPFYSSDEEKENGIPTNISTLLEKFRTADGFLISSPEYNGFMSAAFKNTLDWLSRAERLYFGNKPTVLLSTSPGEGGGASVMKFMQASFPFAGADIVSTYSVKSFYKVFSNDAFDVETDTALYQVVKTLEDKLLETAVTH